MMREFTTSAFAAGVMVLLGGCPDSGSTTKDVGDVTEELPDGATCTPGAVVSCVEEGSPPARFCNAQGSGTVVDNCPGEHGACRNAKCFDLPDGAVCFPGEVDSCIVENSPDALICNQSASAFVPGRCKGEDGNDSQCRHGACTACYPGAKKCQDDSTVVVCKDDGSGWQVYTTCISQSQVCTGQYCEELCERNIKFNSYIGCDYFATDLDNAFVPGGGRGYYDAQGAQYAVVVANPPDSPRSAKVEINQMEGGVIEKVLKDSKGQDFPTEDLLPGELRVYKLPRRDINGTEVAPLAYRVTSSVPIIAYQFNPLENENVFSNDASLLLPATLLGSEYIVMTREETFNELRGYFTVVAVMEGETTVSVTVSDSTQAGVAHEGAPNEAPIPHMVKGETRNFTLKQFDVLNIETDRPGADLTGSRVLANQRVAVFGGSEAANSPNTARCVNIDDVTGLGVCEWDHHTQCRNLLDCVNAGFNTCCADHLEDQLFPVKIWGSHVIATKLWDRGKAKDQWRIMAGADNTRVVIVPPLAGVSVPVLNKGEFYEFESASSFEIHAQDEKPIMVGQFMEAQDAPDPNVGGVSSAGDAGIGDPAFILPVPVEQFRNDFVVLCPAEYADNFMNVVFPTGAALEVDGADIPAGDFELVGSGAYSVYRQRLEPGAHTIRSTEPAGVIVYGWDQYVSYGYTGGMDLEEIRKETPFTPPATP